MPGTTEVFRLVNYQQPGLDAGPVQVGLGIGEQVLPLATLAEQHPTAQRLFAANRASAFAPGIQGLLTDWRQNFQLLSELAAQVEQEGIEQGRWQKAAISLNEMHVLAPVVHPTKMLFAGANYERHVKQVENWEGLDHQKFRRHPDFKIDKSTTRPYLFVKLPYCIIGPYDPLVYPHPYHRLDWEVELGVVIGRRGKHIPVERAMDYIAGFITVNDYSLRELNMRQDWPHFSPDWFGGKNFDTSAALGPYLVPKEFVPDYLDLRLSLWVDGEQKQNASTKDMIFKPDEMIAFASSITTLEPGDVIATGSPEGAGFATGKFLNVGNIVETEVEGLGRQRTTVIEGAEVPSTLV